MLPLVADWEGRFGAVWGGRRYQCPRLAHLTRSDATYPVPGTSCSHPVWGTTSVRLRLPRSNLPMQGTVQQKQARHFCVGGCVCVCAVLSVRILVYQTSPSPASAPPPTTDMVRPATLHYGRNPQTPMSWQQGLCPALCPPPSASLCSSREILAPKLHGVASTILLIRVGVC